jgi:predicted dehydrogenase
VGPLAIVEPDVQRCSAVSSGGNIECFTSLSEGLDWGPSFVVIATPSSMHVDQAIEAAKRGCHLFIEKPLSISDKGLNELQTEIDKKNLISLVGCNMRFHPGPSKLKTLLNQGEFGKVLFARIHTGSYLPSWRPDQDYRMSYSANSLLGGGCILDCIHEIDLAMWYLGGVKEVFCRAEHISSLEIDVEDVAFLIFKHSNGALSEVHLDYVQRTYERGCHIVGEQGSMLWNFNDGLVRWYDAHKNQWKNFRQPEDWQLNQMYVDEMSHFLRCLQLREKSMLPVSEAIGLMNVVFAAKRSAVSLSSIKL